MSHYKMTQAIEFVTDKESHFFPISKCRGHGAKIEFAPVNHRIEKNVWHSLPVIKLLTLLKV